MNTRHTFLQILVGFGLAWAGHTHAADSPTHSLTVGNLRCEYRVNPLGIDNPYPRLSWKLEDAKHTRGQRQTAYHVLVASSMDNLQADKGDLWDSGWIDDSESVNRVYAGKPLESSQMGYWKVRVRDVDGRPSCWSPCATFSIGLLKPADWHGAWIYRPGQVKTDHNWFRKRFELSETPSSALAYVASFGYHELYVNGKKVGDGVMNPVSSFMKKRLPYRTYDIREYLKPGDNVIALWHAAGWTRWPRVKEYPNPPFAFRAQVEIKSTTNMQILVTDESWMCRKSHSEYIGPWDILNFGGERIDARQQVPGWNKADFDDSGWDNAAVFAGEISSTLSAQRVEPQVRYEQVTPVAITPNEDGSWVVDMGRNYSGFFQMRLRNGSPGQTVTFEISDQREKRCNWGQKSEYVFDETGTGTFTNRFNIAGGRWVTVSGLNYQPDLEDITGHVITCDRERISRFECSNPLLNHIYKINLDTYIANTLDGIHMDCPHRERRGWGEVTVATMYGDALPNFESGAFVEQYTQYMRDAQLPDGQIRGIINEQDRPFFMWKANNPITVWAAYQMLGDKQLLEDNYESMERWMTWLFEHSNYASGGALIIGAQGEREFPGLGDWCTPRGNFWESMNSPEAAHFNNCLYAYMLDIAVKIATTLDKPEDARKNADRLKVQRQATHDLSYNPATGEYVNGRQVSQAFALIAGVPPESESKKVYDRLVDEVLYHFPYYDAGSSGQALYTRYFIEHGERMDLIYELLKDETHPSYGYFIAQGETTWPERWSSTGNSRIHTCYTGIGGYFIKGFGGIRPDPERPGMRHFLIKPAPVGDLTFANTQFESRYGTIVVNWKRTGQSASYHIEVPVNSRAKVYLPAVDRKYVKEGNLPAEQAEAVRYLGTKRSDAVGVVVIYEVGSGIYDFEVTAVPEVTFPEPMDRSGNLARIARMSASSMHIDTEKIPGFEAFKANDGNPETFWRAAGQEREWLEAAWIRPETFDTVMIDEVGDNITSYQLQAWRDGGWQTLATGSACGVDQKHQFERTTANKMRLLVETASGAPQIAEIVIRTSNDNRHPWEIQ